MKYQLITDAVSLRKYLESFDINSPIVGDTETTDLSVSATLLGISLFQPALKDPCFIAVKTPFFKGVGITLPEIRSILNPLFAQTKMIFHNAKYDLGVFQTNRITLPELYYDTLTAVHLTDADRVKKLEVVVKEDFGYEKKDFKTIIGMKWDKIKWDENTHQLFSLETLAEYASEDAYWTYQLYEKYSPEVTKMNLDKLWDKIEKPLTLVLKNMKLRGVRIDKQILNDLQKQCDRELSSLEKEIYKSAGTKFNINSGKQKGEILYKKLGYKPPFLTKGGAPSTDGDALSILAAQGCEVAQKISEHSGLSTLQNSFITAIPLMVDGDGRLRADFNSSGTTTGRFSSSNPNLQNQPNNSKFPVRSAFIPAEGYMFVCLDWSQIELRIAAHFSKDEKLMKAFADGRDIHQEVADSLGITRKAAKGVNFGILYGLGAKSLAGVIGGDERAAQKILDNYYEIYKGIKAWKHYVETNAVKNGYVRNLFGRIRPLRGVQSNDKRLYYGSLRQAVNTMIQGSSADMMKLAMVRISDMIQEQGYDAHILLTVHDELLIEVKKEYANELFWKVKKEMENVIPMRVPIVADGKILDNWGQMKDDDFIGYQVEPDGTLVETKHEAYPYTTYGKVRKGAKHINLPTLINLK